MVTHQVIYLCPICFAVSLSDDERHAHQMVCCDTGEPGDDRRRPLSDDRGHLTTRTPRWFLEALGRLPAHSGAGLPPTPSTMHPDRV